MEVRCCARAYMDRGDVPRERVYGERLKNEKDTHGACLFTTARSRQGGDKKCQKQSWHANLHACMCMYVHVCACEYSYFNLHLRLYTCTYLA